MADRISDNVGKKIVEALRMQSQPAEQEEVIEELTEEVPSYISATKVLELRQISCN